MQSMLPLAEAYVPIMQGQQKVAPLPVVYVPGAQLVHAEDPCAAYVPLPQMYFSVSPGHL